MLIKSFKLFESRPVFEYPPSVDEGDTIHRICTFYGIKNFTIDEYEDGSIDVNGDVNLSGKGLTKLPLNFNTVSGNFYCANNSLTSLEGCPPKVNRFNCSSNSLTSLEGCPQIVEGEFRCQFNLINNFGTHPFTYGFFNCNRNPIEEIYNLNPNRSFIEYLIEYQVIRGNKVIKQRLIKALEDSGWEETHLPLDSLLVFKNYEVI